MDPVSAFRCCYGYITNGEGDVEHLKKRTEALLSPNSLSQIYLDSTLFIDADGIPYTARYCKRADREPSFIKKLHYLYGSCTGYVFEKTIKRAYEIFSEQMRVATACITVENEKDLSLQELRDRARRLQVLEIERSHLYQALRRSCKSYKYLFKSLSPFYKGMLKVCMIFAMTSISEITEQSLPRPPALPMRSEEFTERYYLRTISETISPLDTSTSFYSFMQDSMTLRIPVQIVVQVLQKTSFPITYPKARYGTIFSVRHATSAHEIGKICFIQEKNILYARFATEASGTTRSLLKVATDIFLTESATKLHFSGNDGNPCPTIIYKKRVKHPINGKNIYLEVLGNNNSSVFLSAPDGPPFLPVGSDEVLVNNATIM